MGPASLCRGRRLGRLARRPDRQLNCCLAEFWRVRTRACHYFLTSDAEPTYWVSVGTVSGNVDSVQAARSTLDLLELAGCSDIPVAVVERDPLAGPYNGAVPHIHGVTGTGDAYLARSAGEAVDESAAEFIVRLAREHQGRLRLLTPARSPTLRPRSASNPDFRNSSRTSPLWAVRRWYRGT